MKTLASSGVAARWLCACMVVLGLLAAGTAQAQANGATDMRQAAEALHARHAVLKDKLVDNAFRRPLVLESTEEAGDLKGDIYAVVEHPYATVRTALGRAASWCDILILHLNIKSCRAAEAADRSKPATVTVNVGKKYDQPIEQTYEVAFDYRVAAQGADYLQVRLNAENGPLGTKDYRIVLEAVPLEATRSFIHLAYSYAYGFAARVAMKGYLATVGSGKVGFSVAGKDADGKPLYVGGVRGVVERNTMRYYLAIDAYLDSLAAPKGEQQEKRLHDWYAATEGYATQLHELSEDEYLQMKRSELKRQAER
jgi:hypothetical protein